jgi:hypothetical protein
MYQQELILKKGKATFLSEFRNAGKGISRFFVEDQKLKDTIPKKIQKEGLEEAQATLTRDFNLQGEKFDDVVKRAQTILFKARTVFPFEFFPSDLIIDITKVTVVTRNFFLSGRTQSINVKDIMDVVVETGPFFSSMKFLDIRGGWSQGGQIRINYLTKKDARHAREIVEGLLAANKAGVDITKIPRRELIARLPELRRSQITPAP